MTQGTAYYRYIFATQEKRNHIQITVRTRNLTNENLFGSLQPDRQDVKLPFRFFTRFPVMLSNSKYQT